MSEGPRFTNPSVQAVPDPSRRRRLAGGLALLLGGAMVAMQWARQAHATSTPGESVTLAQARQAHERGQAVLIDIREPHEHAAGIAAGVRLLPTSQWRERWHEIPTDPAKPVYLICATQNRSRAAWQRLQSQPGYEHVRYVVGGMSSWKAQGWPTTAP